MTWHTGDHSTSSSLFFLSSLAYLLLEFSINIAFVGPRQEDVRNPLLSKRDAKPASACLPTCQWGGCQSNGPHPQDIPVGTRERREGLEARGERETGLERREEHKQQPCAVWPGTVQRDNPSSVWGESAGLSRGEEKKKEGKKWGSRGRFRRGNHHWFMGKTSSHADMGRADMNWRLDFFCVCVLAGSGGIWLGRLSTNT